MEFEENQFDTEFSFNFGPEELDKIDEIEEIRRDASTKSVHTHVSASGRSINSNSRKKLISPLSL